MGGEADGYRISCGIGQLLLDLRRMAVAGHPVGLDAFIDLAEEVVRLGSPTCPGGSGLGIYDDRIAVNQSFLEKGVNSQDRAGGITAGIGQDPSPLHLLPVDLTQSIDCLRQILGRFMRNLIPLLIDLDILQTKIRAEIDNLAFLQDLLLDQGST